MSRLSGDKRVSALKRLGSATAAHRPVARGSSVVDARQLLTGRQSASFDARQMLNRQDSNSSSMNVIVRNHILPTKTVANDSRTDGKMVLVTGLKDMKVQDGRLISKPAIQNAAILKKKQIISVGSSTFVTIRNPTTQTRTVSNPASETISLTKTIKNPSARPDITQSFSSLSNEKVVISVVNDQCSKTSKSTSVTNTNKNRSFSPDETLPNTRCLHDASIQTHQPLHLPAPARPPIRTNAHQRNTGTNTIQSRKRAMSDEEDSTHDLTESHEEMYEPPVKRTTVSVRKSSQDDDQQIISKSMKRVSTAAASSSPRIQPTKSKQSTSSSTGTVLVTNLQPSVTEEDVIELFDQVGPISEIKTLSRGCVQIVFMKYESAEQAVSKYHNRLLDGQFMYVSLQQSAPALPSKLSSGTTKTDGKSSSTMNPSQASKETNNTASNQPLKLNCSTNNSKKIVIDPAFIRQALFHPSNNTTNLVQFQVKL